MEESTVVAQEESDDFESLADLLRTIAHPARLHLVQLLIRDHYSVGELADICGIQNHMASEHLRLMKRSGFLGSRRRGRKIFYYIANNEIIRLMLCMCQKNYAENQ